jgi:hypothetical protein
VTARIDFHIRPGIDYVHTIVFSGPVTLPEGAWSATVRSKAGRTLLEPTVTVSAPSTLIVEADAADTGSMLTGEGTVVLIDPDDVARAEGYAFMADEGLGAETTAVPYVGDGDDDSAVAVTVQGVVVPGEDGEDGLSAGDITYQHVQSLPDDEWAIPHPFGTVFNITVIDSAGDTIEGDEDLNTTPGIAYVRFGGGFSGAAYLIGIPA